MQNKIFSVNKTLKVRNKIIDLSEPKVMGIINVTPDSFFEGSRQTNEIQILKKTEQMIRDGATFIDLGGYSSRPGAAEVPEEEEWKRIAFALTVIKKEFPEILISTDTFRSAVARRSVLEGADMINDISGGHLDMEMFATISSLKVPYILMHMRGNPQTMSKLAHYENLVKEIVEYFQARLYQLNQLGVTDVIIDPGFGFAKTIEQNFHLLKKLNSLQILGRPLLVGVSRKSMIWKTLSITSAEALNGTTSLNTLALNNGASILRVHDVKEAIELIRLMKAYKDA